MGFICLVNMPSTCVDLEENPWEPGNFYSAEACKSDKLSFPGNKCFLETSGVMMKNVGKNRLEKGETNPLNYEVSSEGAKVSISTTNRPSLGTTHLGHTEGEEGLEVRFGGQLMAMDSTHANVVGMVFGYRSHVDFFVVASSGIDPQRIDLGGSNLGTNPSTNWYVARVHMTCGAECVVSTATSDAIRNPAGHPTEITVLKEGTAYWKSNTHYIFSIDFDPNKLEMDVVVLQVDGRDKVTVLSTGGRISAAVTDVADSSVVAVADVDSESRKGGYIGLYTDSLEDTHWEGLGCLKL